MDNLTGPICGRHLLLGGVFYFLCYNIPISMASSAYAQIRSEGGFLFANLCDK